MESCDVLVVGGGPAGSTCARQLRRAGLDVMVMDKAMFPRDKVCAGWITPAVVTALDLDLADYGERQVLQPITGFMTGLIDGRQQEIRYPTTVSYGIRRVEFDDYLLRRADVRLRLGDSARSIVRQGKLWVVNDAVATPLLIGAGGHFCPVARMMGARIGSSEKAVVAKEIEVRLSSRQIEECAIRPDTPELFFCRDLKGYGWCLRKGDHLNLGLGREDSRHLSRHLDAFRFFLARQGKLPTGLPPGLNGHSYALYGHAPRRLLDDGVLLVGDAAGLAAAQSGEGIWPAVESALLAAAVVGEAAGNYRQERLKPYEKRLLARFGTPSPQVSGRMVDAARGAIGRLLLHNRWFNRHVLMDRWFLHARNGAPAAQ